MIYYFSGTGNSAWVAKELSRQLNDQALNIVEIEQNEPEITVPAGQNCGIIFPVHAWAPPLPVEKFVQRIHVELGAYCFALCSCGDWAGHAIKRLAKFIPLDAGWSLIMPNNYILAFDVDPLDIAKKKVERVRNKLIEISAKIHIKSKIFEIRKGPLPFLTTFIGIWGFRKFAISSKPFSCEDTCTGCGICAKNCPNHNIRIIAERPVWDDHCCQCLSCINRCPVHAIQYGKKTVKRGRYFFPPEWE